MASDERDRHKRGLRKLGQLDPDAARNLMDSLSPMTADLGRYAIEFPFGDIYSREALDLKSREIATIASLTTLGNAPRQLKVHIRLALNAGCSREEIVEVIMQMAVYAGFPAALNGIYVAQEVFAEADG